MKEYIYDKCCQRCAHMDFKIQCYILSRNVKIPVIILHFKHFCNILNDNILF